MTFSGRLQFKTHIYLLYWNRHKDAMYREGIIDDGTMDYDMALIDYASFLFRKRNDKNMAMSRFLRYELNNLLFSQKLKGES